MRNCCLKSKRRFCRFVLECRGLFQKDRPLSGSEQKIPVTARVFEAECLISGPFYGALRRIGEAKGMIAHFKTGEG